MTILLLGPSAEALEPYKRVLTNAGCRVVHEHEPNGRKTFDHYEAILCLWPMDVRMLALRCWRLADRSR